MPNKLRILAYLLLGLAVLGGVGAWVAYRYEWVEITERGSPKQEAQHNSLHAGLLLLRASGYRAEVLARGADFDQLPPGSTLVLQHPGRLRDTAQRERLLAWIRQGGHLLLAVDNDMGAYALYDALGLELAAWFSNTPWQPEEEEEKEEETSEGTAADSDDAESGPACRPTPARELLIENQALPVTLRGALFKPIPDAHWQTLVRGEFPPPDEDEEDEEDWDAELPADEADESDYPRYRSLESFHALEDERPDAEQLAAYARFSVGKGLVTAGYLDNQENDEIGKQAHARLFLHLATLPGEPGAVYFLLDPELPSLFGWLWRHAPEAVFASLLLLATVLWRWMPGFGPRLPATPASRPGLGDHLAASGDFLLQHRCYRELLAPLRDEVTTLLNRMRQHHPQAESLPALGAIASGLSESRVAQALEAEPASPQEFQRYCEYLTLLRDRARHYRPSPTSAGIRP